MAATPPERTPLLAQKDLPLSSRKSTIYGSALAFLALTYVTVSLRFYVRLFSTRTPGWDDFFIFIGLISTTAAHIFMFYIIENGMGQHSSALTPADLKKFGLVIYLGLGTFCISAAVTKIAILFQYLRIFEKGKVRMLCIGMLAFTGVWGFFFSFIAWFPCFPVRGAYDISVKARCYGFLSRRPTEFTLTMETHAISNMLLDIIILIIPMVLFRKPGLKSRQIWGMIGVFFLGAVSCALASARVYVLAKNPASAAGHDMSWHAPSSVLLSALEISVALTSASIPIFWPALVNLRFGQILLIQEVKVTSEIRHRGVADEELVDLAEESRGSSIMAGSERSLRQSFDERSLRESSSKTPLRPTTTQKLTSEERYYKDAFVAGQVTPLGHKDSYRVNAERAKYLEQMKILPKR